MARRIAKNSLNGTTIEILNTIRQNARQEYQDLVPTVTTAHDIPKVGEVLYGNPSLANQFVGALVNRIAFHRIKSAMFNNKFAPLKKGYLEYGETIEEVFVGICKAMEFSPEKGAAREHKRYLPDVRAAFHAINWKVIYPVTVDQYDLKQAFLSADGVTELITKIVNSVYGGAEYDEFLLFKYLIIKSVAHGKMHPIGVDTSDWKMMATAFRGTSNSMEFMSREYNEAGVLTTSNKNDQYIFMDAKFNAAYDVNVLASAFNMDKTTFMGRLVLIDSFTTFDNERFDVIRAASDGIEEVTEEELDMMDNVIAVLADSEWFQVYDNLNIMKESETGSGLYWNYFLHNWKTISCSPFSNAVVFVDDEAIGSMPGTITLNIDNIITNEAATMVALTVDDSDASLLPTNAVFEQTAPMTTIGIAVNKYGALAIPSGVETIPANGLALEVGGATYIHSDAIALSNLVTGGTITMTKVGVAV